MIEPYKIPKEDIPIMISEDLHIITIPKGRNPHMIMWSGDRGAGKTLNWLSYIGNLYHRQHEHIFIANDHAILSDVWNTPCKNPRFIQMLKIAGLEPKPLPIVQLYPSRRKFVKPIEYGVDYLKTALSWEDVLDNYDEFFDFGGSLKYVSKLIPRLKKKKNLEEIGEVVATLALGKATRNVAGKIMALFEQLWNDKLVDIADDEALARIKIIDKFKLEKEFPVEIALMYLGVIPTLITSTLSKDLMDKYLNSKLLNIFENQVSPGWFRDNKKVVYIAIDEFQVLETRFKETRSTLDMIGLEGRNRRTGLLYCAQNVDRITRELTDNTSYAICLNQSGPKDINHLRDLFSLSKSIVNEIKVLDPEKREVVACTKERFHSYDLISGKRTKIKGEAVRGVYLPPLCHTVQPIE